MPRHTFQPGQHAEAKHCQQILVCPQVLTLTDGPAITSLAVAPGGAHLIAHMVAHTLQLWPLASITSRLQAIPPAESPARAPWSDPCVHLAFLDSGTTGWSVAAVMWGPPAAIGQAWPLHGFPA